MKILLFVYLEKEYSHETEGDRCNDDRNIYDSDDVDEDDDYDDDDDYYYGNEAADELNCIIDNLNQLPNGWL